MKFRFDLSRPFALPYMFFPSPYIVTGFVYMLPIFCAFAIYIPFVAFLFECRQLSLPSNLTRVSQLLLASLLALCFTSSFHYHVSLFPRSPSCRNAQHLLSCRPLLYITLLFSSYHSCIPSNLLSPTSSS